MSIASETCFGVEFETTLPGRDQTSIGPYHNGYAVPYLPEGWKAERDGSIRTTGTRKACEFVSPKLCGTEGIEQVRSVIETLTARGARVNPTCGLHITVTWNGSAQALAKLISLFGNYERGIYASTGSRRREAGTYCKGLKGYGSDVAARARCQHDRFHGLNLTHLARGANRIEFRVFAGSLNADKVIGHILMWLIAA